MKRYCIIPPCVYVYFLHNILFSTKNITFNYILSTIKNPYYKV